MNQIFIKRWKWIFVFSFVVAIFSVADTFVFASPPVPTPVCSISGVIKSVEFKDAYDEACLKEPYGCPTDMELHHPARYFFDVSINSVSHVSGDTSFNTCQNMYPVGKISKIFINKDKVKSGDTFSVNQKIDGVVRSFWGASFDSYNLGTIAQQKYIRNLYFGLKNSSVSTLQGDLSTDSSIYPEKLVTGYFGPLTLKAVKRFQAKYGIIQTGYVGPLTRAKLNELFGGQ
ncbi:MAG: peptidoglycan-binding domain-containing protein [Patescibacteria group bacterium]